MTKISKVNQKMQKNINISYQNLSFCVEIYTSKIFKINISCCLLIHENVFIMKKRFNWFGSDCTSR